MRMTDDKVAYKGRWLHNQTKDQNPKPLHNQEMALAKDGDKNKTDEDTVNKKKMSKDQGLKENRQGPEEDLLKFELTTCSNRIQRKTFSYYFITAVLWGPKKYNPTVCQQHRLILTQRTTAHRLRNVLEKSQW